jgi:hypothetical protein
VNHKYIDCCCQCLDHVLRIWYDEEDNIYSLEYKLEKLPWSKSGNQSWTYYPNRPFQNFMTSLSRRYYIVKEYLTCIRFAILGRPLYFQASTQLDYNGAFELKTFIEQTLSKKDFVDSQ